jgi:hypothetical protein
MSLAVPTSDKNSSQRHIPNGRTGWSLPRSTLLDAVSLYLDESQRTVFDQAFSLNTADELHKFAVGAGLKDAHVRFEHRPLRHPDPSGMIPGFMTSMPIAAQLGALPDDRRRRFVEYVAHRLAPYVDNAGLASPMENHFLLAFR